MATLTKLESKLAELLGLAMAATFNGQRTAILTEARQVKR